VKDTCKTGYTIKVIWAHETDSPCECLRLSAADMTLDVAPCAPPGAIPEMLPRSGHTRPG
jgi:hypothetical protein